MDLRIEFHRLCQTETRRWLLIVVVVGITHLMFQFLVLPYGNALTSLLPHSNGAIYDKATFPILHSSTKSSMVRNPLTVDKDSSLSKDSALDSGGGDAYNKSELRRTSEDLDNDFVPDDEDMDNDGDVDGFVSNEEDLDNPIELVVDRDVDESDDVMIRNGTATLESIESKESNASFKYASELGRDRDHPLDQNEGMNVPHKELAHARFSLKSPVLQSQAGNLTRNISYLRLGNNSSFDSTISKNVVVTSKNESAKPGKKKMRCEMPPKSITSINEMNQILARHRRSSRAMRPRWSSPHDREILAAKVQIENAPLLLNDRDLYAPLFRNLSKFKRSYELMERTLKVYIYKDGKKPIFHLPIMKGLYASEGWFMKLMEGNKHYIVKDPRRAHLFYMPFSSRMLEYTLYVRNSHNRTNLRQYLKEYSEKLAAKYPFWNRTDGADHFLVACHDWAPYETRHHMEHCIKALCNADVTSGFKIGRDVSLPETYVRSARNPLRDLGGKAPSERSILAFYAGNMHGYLRPILLKYWKDKDPSMKIFGPMPPGVASKMNYIQHMKSSKFCICPRGYEVNSPRVVEAIFYECVPVIISDNFVPPFFEVFDWGSFSLILAEKDIPNLKEILSSVPEKRYLELQLGVRKVQRHFLWHPNPVKYDLFYMTLHSIWHNRVYQIKAR